MPLNGALIFADGGVPPRALLDATWPDWAAGVRIHIAADGGARSAAAFGIRLDYWVGDGDSIDDATLDRLALEGVAVQRAAPDKDESDTELALLAAIRHGADAVVILGALGGVRFDHALANIGLLRHPALDGRPVRLYDEVASRISLISSPDDDGIPVTVDFEGRRGDLVSLLPLGLAAEGVRTEGLQFELRDEVLSGGRTRGLSNIRTADVARITVEYGWLLVIETPATVRP
ncbi:MAG TPA: thiamine diphosphokinase [Candidatus Limnocylindrales bacterium]